jgi:hypothetical protein
MPPLLRPTLAATALLLLGATRATALAAQDDPRTTQPERPTVATHAYAVAPGYLEIESGIELDRNPDHSHTLGTPTVLKVGLAPKVQLGIQTTLVRPPGFGLGVGDLTLALKLRLADHLPVLGAFAILPSVKLPVADADHGTGTTDGSLLLISSHTLGPVSLDVNVGYTRRSGNGSAAPKSSTVWTVAAGFPLGGDLGFATEVFGFPRTSGAAGADGTVALLGGPTVNLRNWLTVDAGVIIQLSGPQPDALYAGLVANLGRLW